MASYSVSKKVFTVLFVVLSIVVIALFASGSSERQLKNIIIDEIHNADGKDIVIDLNKFLEKRIQRLCIQKPYQTKIDAEKIFETKICAFTFVEVDDKYFKLWIFTDQQTPMQITFHRWRELNFGFGDSSKICISSSKLNIVNSQLYINEEE